jgi:CDP-diacylglycerol--glycerol-3-phosphate 3-phosphatidyltransferase
MNRLQRSIPNWLSAIRLVLTPLLLLPALRGERGSFLLLGLLLVLTDVLDGALARAWRTVSYRGQVLDSVADTVFHATLYGLALFQMWAEAKPYLCWLLLPLLWFVLDIPAGAWLTGRPRAMHLWGKKTLSHGYVAWLTYSLLVAFYVPGIVILNIWAFAGFLEEIGIYLVARERVDERVTSIFQWRSLPRANRATGEPGSLNGTPGS